MRICITNAKGRLGDLIERAQKGEDVVFTRHGLPVARLVPIYAPAPTRGAPLRKPRPQPRNRGRAR